MSFPTLPKWAKDKNYFWHSNPESRPLDVTYFDKLIIRPKVSLAWEILKNERDGDRDSASALIAKYDNDNANMFSGRLVQEMVEKFLLEHKSQEECIEYGSNAFNEYKPRTWDDGKDADKIEINRDEFATVFKNAAEGIQEAQLHLGLNQLEGEKEVFTNIEGLALPYYGKPDFTHQIELKTKWSTKDVRAKSGSRASSLPNQPVWSHLCQVAGYWYEKKRPQIIIYANKMGYRMFHSQNCEQLSEDALSATITHVAAKCRIREHQLKSTDSAHDLMQLIEPDFGHFYAWDRNPEVVDEAKKLWGFKK